VCEKGTFSRLGNQATMFSDMDVGETDGNKAWTGAFLHVGG